MLSDDMQKTPKLVRSVADIFSVSSSRDVNMTKSHDEPAANRSIMPMVQQMAAAQELTASSLAMVWTSLPRGSFNQG